MQERTKGVGLVEAVEDLKRRTLASLSSEMARLVYLSSTRDYVTGRYYHDGLAFRFTGELAEIAVAFCHQEVFERIGTASLADLVREIEAFIRSTNAEPHKVLDAWKKLQPYRVLIPQDCDSLTSEFFF